MYETTIFFSLSFTEKIALPRQEDFSIDLPRLRGPRGSVRSEERKEKSTPPNAGSKASCQAEVRDACFAQKCELIRIGDISADVLSFRNFRGNIQQQQQQIRAPPPRLPPAANNNNAPVAKPPAKPAMNEHVEKYPISRKTYKGLALHMDHLKMQVREAYEQEDLSKELEGVTANDLMEMQKVRYWTQYYTSQNKLTFSSSFRMRTGVMAFLTVGTAGEKARPLLQVPRLRRN